MANSDWASEAFPRKRDRAQDIKNGVFADPSEAARVLFEQDCQVETFLAEVELSDGCEQCFAHIFEGEPDCEVHRSWLDGLRGGR